MKKAEIFARRAKIYGECCEGIDAGEGVDWRAGPVKGAAMGFKNLSLNKY